MSAEVQVIFKTTLPEEYQVPDVTININTGAGNKELTQIVKQLINDEGRVSAEDLKSRKLNFMVTNTFLTGTFQELIDKLGGQISSEQSIEVFYTFALEKPKPTHSLPQDEWISSIHSLSHILNEKAKTYVVGFFNGDLKVFSKHDNKEVLSVKSLHTDRIEDFVFIRNDALDKKIVVSISGKPDPQLRIGELSHFGSDKSKQFAFNIIAEAKEEYAGTEGFRAVSENPMNNQYICTGGVIS
jgi:hypothetical protein